MIEYGQLKADMVPIKSLYFVSGSIGLEPGEKYSGLYGKSTSGRIASFLFKWSLFSLL